MYSGTLESVIPPVGISFMRRSMARPDIQPTTIDSIELPMAAGPAACRQSLLEAMLSIGAAPVKAHAVPAILSPP